MRIERLHPGSPATVLCALAALLATPAAAAEPAARDTRYALELRAEASGGTFDGEGVRDDSGSMATVEISAHPEYRGEGWSLDLPFRVEHRETFGAHLPRTAGGFEVAPWLELGEGLAVGLVAGASGASCPSWPDPYQREPGTGALAPTDRFSHLAARGGVALRARSSRQQLRARYRYASYAYEEDPNVDLNAIDPNDFAADDPEQLAPADHVRHELDLAWRYDARAWALALRLDYTLRNEEVLLARSAGEGSTRGRTTPLGETALGEASAELELRRLGGRLDLSVAYAYAVQEDGYEGYASFTEHHPRLAARLDLTARLAAVARYEGWFRTYGPSSTSPERLEWSAHRASWRSTVGGELAYRLARGLVARAQVEWTDRFTNYPDAAPPPAGHGVDWDYTNLRAAAGLEYRL